MILLAYWKWIVAAALIAALSIAYNVHVDRLIDKAVVKAVTARDAEWRKAESDAITAARNAAKEIEARHVKDLADLGAIYEREMLSANKQVDARIASVHAGYRLRVTSGCTSAGNDSKAATAPTGSDGAAGAQFLGEADSAFLTGEAKRADDIVRQLHLCQATVISDRKEKP